MKCIICDTEMEHFKGLNRHWCKECGIEYYPQTHLWELCRKYQGGDVVKFALGVGADVQDFIEKNDCKDHLVTVNILAIENAV